MVITLCVINSTSAVFFSGEVLKRDDVTVVILGDQHIDTDPNILPTKKQTNDLLKIAKKYQAYLMVEDMASYVESQGRERSRITQVTSLLYAPEKEKRVAITTPLEDLCQKAAAINIKNINVECRSTSEKITADAQTIEKIKQFKDPQFQKYLDYLAERESFRQDFAASIWLELNTVYKFAKIFKTKKPSLIIIAVGVGHLRPISEMLQKIYNFKVVFQKNLFRNIPVFGPTEKNNEFAIKQIFILNEHALDIPKFFKEALKAQPIRSKL